MKSDRLDDLLERALRGEDLPADTTSTEREQIARLVAAGATLQSTAPGLQHEADASVAPARARFDRFIAAQQASTVTASPRRARWFARLPHRGMMLAASAVAVGVLAVGAAFAFQAAFSTTGTADAQVLSANDYAQVQGVITDVTAAASQTTVTVQSAFGSVRVGLSSTTTLQRVGSSIPPSQLARGDLVTISGVAANGSAISAQTIDVGAGDARTPAAGTLKPLKALSAALEGKVVAFAVSPDGSEARVLLEANGKSYVVPLEGGAVERLLARSANALGADVVISNGANATDDIFSLTVGQSSPAPTTASTPLMGVRGVVIARRGPMIEVATTGQQRYTVIVTASTRIVLAKSGLTRPQVRTGANIVGHLVSVAGAVDQSTGRITAELVVVGAKYQPSAQGGTVQ